MIREYYAIIDNEGRYLNPRNGQWDLSEEVDVFIHLFKSKNVAESKRLFYGFGTVISVQVDILVE